MLQMVVGVVATRGGAFLFTIGKNLKSGKIKN